MFEVILGWNGPIYLFKFLKVLYIDFKIESVNISFHPCHLTFNNVNMKCHLSSSLF